MNVRVEVDATSLRLLVKALRDESDGKELKRDLVRRLRAVAQPALEAVRASVLTMGSYQSGAPPLRTAVAAATKISVRTTGRRAGVAIRASKLGMPRGFRNAPKRLNSRKGWRHPAYGNRDKWVAQMGKPGWFDDTLQAFREPAKKEAAAALQDAARRIDAKTRG